MQTTFDFFTLYAHPLISSEQFFRSNCLFLPSIIKTIKKWQQNSIRI